MPKPKHPTRTQSWPHAVAAKGKVDAVFKNKASTPQQKKAACDAYKAAMRRSLREAGL